MKKKLLALALVSVFLVALASVCFALELSVNGWFRVRGHYYSDIDLNKDTTGPNAKDRSYWEQKFVMNPSLKVADNITILGRIRAIDQVWGYNDMPFGLTFDQQAVPGGLRNPTDPNSNFTWDRLWANISVGKYGTFMIGRQDTSLFHNYFVSAEDTYGRVNWMIWPVEKKVLAGLLYDKRGEGNINDMNDGEVSHWCPWFLVFQEKWTLGYVHSWMINYTPLGRGNVHFNDAMLNAKLGPVDLKSEFTYTFGTGGAQDTNFDGVPDRIPDITNSFSMFADLSAPLQGPVTKVSLLFSYFQGYKKDTELSLSGLLGSNVDWVEDWNVDLILFNQILGRVINAIVIRPRVDFKIPGAEKWGVYVAAEYAMADQYARYQQPYPFVKLLDPTVTTDPNDPRLDPAYPEHYDPKIHYVDPLALKPETDQKIARPGWGGAGVHNGSATLLTLGDDKDLGFEVDVGLSYALAKNSDVVLGLGYFAPGKYFATQDPCLGARLMTMIRF